jgi:anaerobic magnesium-protoporphyrin IX monomethyl ester cyclase
MDLMIVAPSAAKKIYQDLSKDFSAIEPNIWAGLLANSVRNKGFDVAILDMDAEHLSIEDTTERINEAKPRWVLYVSTGQNPNASTASMTGTIQSANDLREKYPHTKIAVVGPHVNALPVETLEAHSCLDVVFTNEGVYSLLNLLSSNNGPQNVKGLAYRGYDKVYINPPEKIVPQERLSIDLPGVAYDLMPSLDKYRTSNWHANYQDDTSPFASIYTSLGCIFRCDFCMINIINRTDNDKTKASADFNTFRYWEPEFTIKQFDYLASQGIKHIKVADEMWVLKPKHFINLCDLLIERDYGFNIWAYTRVDTVKRKYLEKLKAAGVNWLALGIEAGSQEIRQEITKGSFKDINIREVIKMIKDAGINVIGNYMFGLGHDTYSTMQETLDLALELNCEAANFYCATALPGSPLYLQAKANGWDFPDSYEGYAFLGYDHVPSRTEALSAKQIVQFRDDAFNTYFKNPDFLNLVNDRFGSKAVDNINRMTKIKLKRKILEV